MAATYPAILQAKVPADFMMQRLDIPWLKVVFYIVVFGTFIETGTAYIHAVNERISEVFTEKQLSMPRWLRPCIAFVALLISIVLAEKVGLIDLIAKGYGALTWVFALVFIAPLLTVGLVKIYSHKATCSSGKTSNCLDSERTNNSLSEDL